MELEFDEEFKERLIEIIEKANVGKIENNSDAAILFHWVRHVNDPMYSWVPDKYKKNLPYYTGEQD